MMSTNNKASTGSNCAKQINIPISFISGAESCWMAPIQNTMADCRLVLLHDKKNAHFQGSISLKHFSGNRQIMIGTHRLFVHLATSLTLPSTTSTILVFQLLSKHQEECVLGETIRWLTVVGETVLDDRGRSSTKISEFCVVWPASQTIRAATLGLSQRSAHFFHFGSISVSLLEQRLSLGLREAKG